jgi:DNA polymerase-3 subunit delta'
MQKLNDLPGHTQVKTCLKKFLTSQKIPNTLLFAGPKGVGKSRFALAFAHTLLQSSKPPHNHPDLFQFYPEGKTHMHPMQSMQTFILHDADRMLPSSANAILKTLEDAPPHAVIILISSHPFSLLPTVRSRCFHLPFSLLSDVELTAHLQSAFQKTEEESRKIALLSQGMLTKAEALAKKADHPITDLAVLAATLSLHRDYISLQKTISDIETTLEKTDDIEELFQALYYYFRDLHLLKEGGDPKNLFFQDREEELHRCLKCPLPPLDKLKKKIKKVEQAISLNIRLNHCLEEFLL